MAVPNSNYYGPGPLTGYRTTGGQNLDQRDVASSSAVGANEEIISFMGQADKSDAQKNYLLQKDAQRATAIENAENHDFQHFL